MHKGVGILVGLIDQPGTRVVSNGTTDRKSHPWAIVALLGISLMRIWHKRRCRPLSARC